MWPLLSSPSETFQNYLHGLTEILRKYISVYLLLFILKTFIIILQEKWKLVITELYSDLLTDTLKITWLLNCSFHGNALSFEVYINSYIFIIFLKDCEWSKEYV